MEEFLHRLRKEVSDLSSVIETNIGLEVQTPIYFPNGDSVVVVLTQQGNKFTIHDSGAAYEFLSKSGMSISSNTQKNISKVIANYGCVFEFNRVTRQSEFEDIAVAATIVANASKSVADFLFHQQKLGIVDFKRQVVSRISEFIGASRLRLDEEVRGESGFSYHVSAVVLDSSANKVVGFVEPVKDHDAATKKFREFWDISRSETSGNVRRISLVDDSRKWDNSDLLILQEVSNVVRLADVRAGMAQLIMN